MLARIRAERPSLAASLAEAVPSITGPGALGLRVPNGTMFHRDQLEDRSNVSIMESAATAVYGEDVRVIFQFGGGEPPPEKGSSNDGRSERSDDPMVRRVLEIFGGRVEDTRGEG